MHATLSARGQTVRYGAAHGVTVAESHFAPGLSIAEHTHTTGYACFTLTGSVVDTIAVREAVAAPGYSCYVPPQTPHANVFGPSGARCLLLELDATAGTFLREAGFDTATPWNGFGGENAWHALVFYRMLRQGAVSSLDFEELVIRAFERHPTTVAKRPRPPAWLSRVREMLDGELKRPPSLAVLAREADVHPMHLVRAFRAYGGCSPGAYVQTRRIAHACRLLLDSVLPLAHLALHLGYHDQSHFTRAFKARVGLTPGAYRATGLAHRGHPRRTAPTLSVEPSWDA